VATADLFPRVNVTGFVGFLSGDVGRLFGTATGNDARAWSITPAVSWAAFDLGSVRARLRASEAQSDAAAANYEKVVLTALEDTENSFVAYGARQAQLKSLTEQAQASRRAADLADAQYREGAADFLVLLDAQRTQLDAEDSVAQAETAVNVVRRRDLQGPRRRRTAVERCRPHQSGANSVKGASGETSVSQYVQ
jgi:outer membrane protein, multidrug efflux system